MNHQLQRTLSPDKPRPPLKYHIGQEIYKLRDAMKNYEAKVNSLLEERQALLEAPGFEFPVLPTTKVNLYI